MQHFLADIMPGFVVWMLLFALTAKREINVYALNCEIVSWKSPPYVYDDKILSNLKNSTNSILYVFAKLAKYEHCKCNLTFMPQYKNYADFMAYVNGNGSQSYSNKSLRVFMPAYQRSILTHPYRFRHVGFVKSPGMTLVGNGFFRSKLYQLTVNGFQHAETFMIVNAFFMLDFGIIIWLCVSTKDLHAQFWSNLLYVYVLYQGLLQIIYERMDEVIVKCY